MLRRLIKWFIQDIFFGIIPLLIHCLIAIVIGKSISIFFLSAELFFLNIEMLMSIYKIIMDLDWYHRNEEVLIETLFISIAMLILNSILYGSILVLDCLDVMLNEKALYFIVIAMTGVCAVIGIGANYIAAREERE